MVRRRLPIMSTSRQLDRPGTTPHALSLTIRTLPCLWRLGRFYGNAEVTAPNRQSSSARSSDCLICRATGGASLELGADLSRRAVEDPEFPFSLDGCPSIPSLPAPPPIFV